MSKDKLDMSLEDIIRLNKQDGRGNNSGRRNFNYRNYRRGSSGFVDRPTGSVRDSARFRIRDDGDGPRTVGVLRGGVQKRENRAPAFTRPKEINVSQWQHDLFDDSDTPITRRASESAKRDSDTSKSAALIISNLHYGVNDTDIKELFGEFGPLVKAAVHYDRSGRSLGTAEVVFGNNKDALQAMKQYNNVPLDGQPMNITVLQDANQSRTMADRIGSARSNEVRQWSPGQERNRVASGGQRFGGRGRRGRSEGRGGPRRESRPVRHVPTKEELDAELDAYNAKMEVE